MAAEDQFPPPPPMGVPLQIAPASGDMMLPVPGPVAQESSSVSSGTSGKVATPGLTAAMEGRRGAAAEQREAGAQRISAGETEAKAMALRQEASNLELEKKNLVDREMTRQAAAAQQEANKRQLVAESELTRKEGELKKLDDASFFGGLETWQKLVYGISLALGGFGAALSKGENVALNRLNKTMDDWSSERRERMAKLREDITSGRSKLGTVGLEYLAKEQSLEKVREAQARSRVGDLAEREYKAAVAAGNKEAAARGEKLVADLRAQEAKLRMEAAAEEEKAQQFLAPTATTDRRDGSVVQAPSAAALRLNEKQMTEARKVIAADQRVAKIYDEIQSHLQEYGDFELLNLAARKQRAQLVKNLVAELKGPDMFNMGAALTPNEEAILNQASGGVDSTSLIDQLPRLLQGREFVKNRGREKLQALGIDRESTEQVLNMDPAQLGAPTAAGQAAKAAAAGKPGGSKPAGAKPKYTPGQVIERGGKKWKVSADGKSVSEVK